MIYIVEDVEFAKMLWTKFRSESLHLTKLDEDNILTWEQLPKGMQDAYIMSLYTVRRDERRIIQEQAMWSTWQRIKAMLTRKSG